MNNANVSPNNSFHNNYTLPSTPNAPRARREIADLSNILESLPPLPLTGGVANQTELPRFMLAPRSAIAARPTQVRRPLPVQPPRPTPDSFCRYESLPEFQAGHDVVRGAFLADEIFISLNRLIQRMDQAEDGDELNNFVIFEGYIYRFSDLTQMSIAESNRPYNPTSPGFVTSPLTRSSINLSTIDRVGAVRPERITQQQVRALIS